MPKSTLTGGRWVTIEHEHVYVKGGAIVAGHVPSDTSKSTKSDAEKWIEDGHASKMFKPDDEVRETHKSEFKGLSEKAGIRKRKASSIHELTGENAAADKYLDRDDLTQAERSLLRSSYFGSADSIKMNKELREKGSSHVIEPPTKFKEVDLDGDPKVFKENLDYNIKIDTAPHIQSAINKSTSGEDQVVYRHFTHDPQLTVGEITKNAGFLSTSRVSLTNWMESTHKLTHASGGLFGYEIAVPAKSRGVLEGANPNELETVFGHGSRFRVMDKKNLKYNMGGKKTQTRTIYQLAYLGPGNA